MHIKVCFEPLCKETQKCVTNRHNMTLASKMALNSITNKQIVCASGILYVNVEKASSISSFSVALNRQRKLFGTFFNQSAGVAFVKKAYSRN